MTEDGRKEFLEFILDQQLSTAVQAYQAEKAGVQLTAEETEEAKAAAADDYEKFLQQFVDYAKQAGSNEPEVYANKIMAESLAKSGQSLSKMKKLFLQTVYNEKGEYVSKETNKKYQVTKNSASIRDVLNIKFDADENVLSNLMAGDLLGGRGKRRDTGFSREELQVLFAAMLQET
jgi:hypothetical protein